MTGVFFFVFFIYFQIRNNRHWHSFEWKGLLILLELMPNLLIDCSKIPGKIWFDRSNQSNMAACLTGTWINKKNKTWHTRFMQPLGKNIFLWIVYMFTRNDKRTVLCHRKYSLILLSSLFFLLRNYWDRWFRFGIRCW